MLKVSYEKMIYKGSSGLSMSLQTHVEYEANLVHTKCSSSVDIELNCKARKACLNVGQISQEVLS